MRGLKGVLGGIDDLIEGLLSASLDVDEESGMAYVRQLEKFKPEAVGLCERLQGIARGN